MEFDKSHNIDEITSSVQPENKKEPALGITHPGDFAHLTETNSVALRYSPVPRFKEGTNADQTQLEQTTQIETGVISSIEERSSSPSPQGNYKLQTFRERKKLYDLTFAVSNKSNETVCEFIQKMVIKIAEAAVKKSCFSNSPEQNSSPTNDLLDDSSPELHLFKHSTFTKEEVSGLPTQGSLLTKLMKKASVQHLQKLGETPLLMPLAEDDPDRQMLRVYLFDAPDYIDLSLSKKHKVEEIIKHLLALSGSNHELYKLFIRSLPENMQDSYKNPELYEIRLLEDEDDPEEYYVPFYDAGALDRAKPIGEFLVSGVAFCRVKGFHDMLKQLTESKV